MVFTRTRNTCPLKNNPSLQRTTTLWPISRPPPSLLEAAGEKGSFLGRPRPFPPLAPGLLILTAPLGLWPNCLLALPCPCTTKLLFIGHVTFVLSSDQFTVLVLLATVLQSLIVHHVVSLSVTLGPNLAESVHS